MKTYILVSSLSLIALTVSAQKKKNKHTPPPKVEAIAEPPKVIVSAQVEETEAPGMLAVPMPSSNVTQISATTITGQPLHFKNVEELLQANVSQLKTLSFKTMTSGKTLDSDILQKIFDAGKQLEFLEIDNFTLSDFPAIKTPHQHLKKLVLNRNNLSTLPSSISNLTALENFDCNNPLTELPPSFAKLKNLQQLGLNGHMFAVFPQVIFSLNKLSTLYLSTHYKSPAKLSALPDLFGQLPDLKELGIENAGLSSLPMSISTLKKLERANFSYNQFTTFPQALAANPHLVFVPFTNNPLQWDSFLASVRKIKWNGLFFLNDTGLTKQQYEKVQEILSKTDVYYDEMND